MSWLCMQCLMHVISFAEYNGWIVPSSPLLPRADTEIAVAYHNHTIFLFGGLAYNNQLTYFDIISKNITSTNEVWNFAANAYGSGQYYTQINNMFYWIDGDSGSTIITYDLLHKNFTDDTTFPNNVNRYACLASTNHSLFVLGGKYHSSSLNTVQIYNISAETWSFGPTMLNARRS
eukprot:195255_1